MDELRMYIARANIAIVNPLIMLLIAAATTYFLWGLFQFVTNASDAAGREEGKRKIIWGLIGLAIMVSVRGILAIVLGTFDITVDPATGL